MWTLVFIYELSLLILYPIFLPNAGATLFEYCSSFVGTFDCWKYKPTNAVLFQDSLNYLGFIEIHMFFKIIFSIYVIDNTKILVVMALNL